MLASVSVVNSLLQNVTSRMGGEYMERLRATTDNIINSNMPGFRKCYAAQPVPDPDAAGSVPPVEVKTDFSEGPSRYTGNPLDFALQGDGYFELEKDGASFFSRNGQFTLAPDGTLTNSGGLTVAGTGGPIRIPSDLSRETITADTDGTIRAAGRQIGQLKIVSIKNPETLVRAGSTLFSATEQTSTTTPERTAVSNRMLESSNTTMYEEMAELISLTRNFEMCQKIIRSRDGAESEMIKAMI